MAEPAVFLHIAVDNGRTTGTELHRLTVLDAEVDAALLVRHGDLADADAVEEPVALPEA